MFHKKWLFVLGLTTFLLMFVSWITWNWWSDEQELGTTINKKMLEKTIVEVPDTDPYELVVVGGEPEGVAAAVSAARNGVKTLLIEHRDGLGGLFTYGWLNYLDIPLGKDGKTLSRGIFAEWHQMVGGRFGFNIEEAKQAFLSLVVNEPNISLMLETKLTEVHLNELHNEITYMLVKNAAGEHVVKAKRFIDATQDADLAAVAGVPYFVGQADLGYERHMAVTPILKVKNIDWGKLKNAAKQGILGGADIKDDVVWGFVELHEHYQPKQDHIRLRGLNIVRIKTENDENFYINALHIFGTDVLSEQSRQTALQKGILEFENVLNYLKQNLPGFEEAYIADHPTELYIRESRHILAEYQLQVSDLWRNRDHWDSIGYGGYPADIQATSLNDLGFIAVNPDRYAIPFRSLVPLQVDNLLVVGRSAGYSSLAAGSARVVPTGMVTGQAAGVATAVSLEHQTDFRTMSKDESLIEELRELLASQGAWVDHFELDYPYKGQYYENALVYLLDHSILPTDYNNELHLDDPFNVKTFANVMLNGLRQMSHPASDEVVNALTNLYYLPQEESIMSRDTLAQLWLNIFAAKNVRLEEAWEQARHENVIDAFIFEKIAENRILTRGEGFYITAHILRNIANERGVETN